MNWMAENAFEKARAGGTREVVVPIVGVRYMGDENYRAMMEVLAAGREVTLHNEDDNPVDVKAVAAYMDALWGYLRDSSSLVIMPWSRDGACSMCSRPLWVS